MVKKNESGLINSSLLSYKTVSSPPVNKKYDLPAGLYYACFEIAAKHRIPVKEVEITLLRHILSEKHGFKCNHPPEEIRIARSKRAYCSWCWTIMDTTQRTKSSPLAPTPRKEFKPRKTFVDKDREEANPMGGLLPDLR